MNELLTKETIKELSKEHGKLIKLQLRDIRAYENNTKLHTSDQISKIRDSIQEFGYNDLIEVDENNIILAGHGRLQALYQLDSSGGRSINTWQIDGLTETQKKAYRIAHNKLNMETGFDNVKLSSEFNSLEDTDNFNDTGFSSDEITEIWEETNPAKAEEDNFEEPKEAKYKIELGEVWQLGEHRLMCGDSTEKSQVDALMGGIKADMVFTDPPYLMGFTGNVHADGTKSQNSKFGAIKNDKMSRKDGDIFVASFIQRLKENVSGAYYICFYRLGIDYVLRALDNINNDYKSIIIWDKGNHTLSNSDYMSKYEPIIYGWFDEHNFEGDRSNFDIWEISRTQKNELHPTMKPIELVSKAINNSTKRDNTVLDLFGGSGSTLIACEQLKRKCYMMELDPHYCSVIIERWEKLTGKVAIKND